MTATKTSTIRSLKALLKHYVIAIVAAAAVALFLRIYAVEAYRIPTDFMSPMLLPGDHIFVNKLAYGNKFWMGQKTPKRADVIIINFPADLKKDYIKRVIAVPGDRVEINGGLISLNGKVISQPVAGSADKMIDTLDDKKVESSWEGTPAESRKMMAVTVPEGHVFVLGDNRSRGQDSRVWGFVPISAIKGRASFIWLSVNTAQSGVRWQRIFTAIQ